MMKYEPSKQLKTTIEAAISECANTLITEMQIGQLDHVRVSIDLNLEMPGKPIGIKWSAFRAERCEFIYDEEAK